MDLLSIRERHKKRFDELDAIVNTIKTLSTTLGADVAENFETVGTDLTSDREVSLKEHVVELENEVSNRLSARSKLVNEMKGLDV